MRTDERRQRSGGGLRGRQACSNASVVDAAAQRSRRRRCRPILQNYKPVTAERLKKPEDGDWLMVRRTYDGWGYSPLDQITPGNVSAAAAGLGVRDRRATAATRRRRSSTTA